MNAKAMKFGVPILTGVVALLAGVAIGSGNATHSAPQVKTVTKTVTHTVTKEVTPQACLDAISYYQKFAEIVADEHKQFSNAAYNTNDPTEFLNQMTSIMANAIEHTNLLTPMMKVSVTNCEANVS